MTMKHMLAATVIIAAAFPAVADPIKSERRQRGEAVVSTLNAGKSQPALEGLRREARSWPMRSPTMPWVMSGRGRASIRARASWRRWRRSPRWAIGRR